MKTKILITALFVISFSLSGISQELTVFPGAWTIKYYEDRIEIDRNRFESLVKTEPEAYAFLKKSNRQRNITIAAVVAELGFAIWYFNTLTNDNSSTVPAVGVLATAGVSWGFTISSQKNFREAVLTYNDKKTYTSSLHIGQTHNGLGMVFSF